MQAAKRLAGDAPELNFRQCISHMPPPSVNKAAHSGFKTERKSHQNCKTEVSISDPTKGTYVLQFFFLKKSMNGALKPRDVTRYPKQGYQWSEKMD